MIGVAHRILARVFPCFAMSFHLRASSLRSRWSWRIAIARSSLWSLRQLSNRSAGSVPSSTAASTAQPGSRVWVQSLNRQRRRAPRRRRTPRRAPPSHSCSSRSPGVSITTPPPGSTISSRCVVVCRPSSSSTRVSFVGHQLVADEPVHERGLADAARAEQHGRLPGSMRARSASHAAPVECADDVDGDADRDGFDLGDHLRRVLEAVGLRQHDLRRRAALPDRDEIPLDPARVEIRAERADDERDVDVGGERLRAASAGGVADDRAAARQHRPDRTRPRDRPSRRRRRRGSRGRAVQAGVCGRRPSAVWTSNAARWAAVTRPGTRPGSRLSASPASQPRSLKSY